MLQLTVLIENNTFIDRYYFGEPALSFFLEADQKRFLFDTGYSGILMKNAELMQIDLSKLDGVILSHGHDDHTGGLKSLLETLNPTKIIAHPAVFSPKRFQELNIGMDISPSNLPRSIQLSLSKEPQWLTERLVFLGEIPRINNFENQSPLGEYYHSESWTDDFLIDDSALAYAAEDGVYVITGCSHSGICNIVEQAKNVTGKTKVLGIIGGFHLFDPASDQVVQTISYLQKEHIPAFYPCHCTSFAVRAKMYPLFPVFEVGVGLSLSWK